MDFQLRDVSEEEEVSLTDKFDGLFKDMDKIEALKKELVEIETSIRETAFSDTDWWDNWEHQMQKLLKVEKKEEETETEEE